MQITFAQSNLTWQGYFSYTQIKAVSESPKNIFAASENALFTKDSSTNIIKTTTTIDGLSGETITSLYYSPTFNKTIIGYENGLLTVKNEKDGSILKVVDIINKNLRGDVKRINNFMEYQGIIYVSTDFGIVQFNLATSKFGDTYFIGDNGAEIKVSQTAIHNGFIYAATANGIRKGDITNPNLIDYKQWQVTASGNWFGITSLGTDLYAVNTSGYIYKYDTNSNAFNGFLQLSEPAVNFRATTDYLIVTTPNSVYIFNKQMVLQRQINKDQIIEMNSTFSCATIIDSTIFIGTSENGLYTTALSNGSVFEDITPTGPLRNNVFGMHVTPTQLWTVYGGYDVSYNPYNFPKPGNPIATFGVSKYTSTSGWLHIPYSDLIKAEGTTANYGVKALSKIIVNPTNEKQVYVSSFYSGLLEIENDKPVFLNNEKNSGLETLTFLGPNYIDVRINGTAFDKSGNLWITNSLINNGLKVLKSNGQWQSYSMKSILNNSENTSYGNIVIDKNNTKWISTNIDGVIGFNENSNSFKKINFGPDQGNLPTQNVRVIAVDAKNQLWIGTTKGLRILRNVNDFQTESKLTTENIVIIEDDQAQELLYEQFITAIKVDGANEKWIGTVDAGVFLVSPDGHQTKYHFTTDNSPLPSNIINDISINSSTGEVFIATSKGLISFKGLATSASENLNNVYVYPNPVRPEYTGTVKINGLLNKANVKITDVAGNLVFEATTEGGTLEWDTTAFGKYKVASGVYMIFISAQDGGETKVKKVMIIR